jgi:hypothetical protein
MPAARTGLPGPVTTDLGATVDADLSTVRHAVLYS